MEYYQGEALTQYVAEHAADNPQLKAAYDFLVKKFGKDFVENTSRNSGDTYSAVGYDADGEATGERNTLGVDSVKIKIKPEDLVDGKLPDLSRVELRGKSSFDCSGLGIKTLEGAPRIHYNADTDNEEHDVYFNCSGNQLINLNFSPRTAVNFNCENNQLTDLRGSLRDIAGIMRCGNNPLDYQKIADMASDEIGIEQQYTNHSDNSGIQLERGGKIFDLFEDVVMHAKNQVKYSYQSQPKPNQRQEEFSNSKPGTSTLNLHPKGGGIAENPNSGNVSDIVVGVHQPIDSKNI